jgi:hypothetical protein
VSDHIEAVQERHGMFRNVPRFLRRAVERRLAGLEADAEQFDREALVNHAKLKRVYALLHIKPAGDRARATLFGKPTADSPRAALRQLARSKNDPQAAAELVRRYRIPYLLVEAALGDVPEPVAVALVEVLGGAELLARLPLLARRDLLKGKVRTALLRRLGALAEDQRQRFPYQKIESVVRTANLDRPLAEAAFALIDSERGQGSLGGDTALLVDESSSMAREGGCLELAAGIGWRLDRALAETARLHVYLFGVEGRPVEARRGVGLDGWRGLFTVPAPAAAGTSVGAAVERLARDRHAVSRLVVVTDGYENRAPRLASAFERYRSATGQRPTINLIQPAGTALQLAVDLRNAQVPFGVFAVDRHLLGLDALVPALRAQAGEDRVSQILAFR